MQYIYVNSYPGLGEEEGYARRGCKVPFFLRDHLLRQGDQEARRSVELHIFTSK